MRILLIEPNLDDNGASRVSLDRATRWVAAGDVVSLVTVHRGHVPPPAATALGLTYATTGKHRLLLSLPAALWRLARLARRSDVVVSGREIDVGLLLGRLAALVARRPFAVTVQSNVERAVGLVPQRQRPVTRLALRTAERVVCVAGDIVPGLLDIGVPAERIEVVRNGADVGAIRAAAAQAPPVALPDAPFLAATGRLARAKAFDLLLRAHAEVLAAGCRHHLVILGEGPERGALQELTDELGVQGTVSMPGFIDNPHAVVARAELFVSSSRWEGYPLSIVEALCVGTACVATDCVAGPREVLDGGTYGELVPTEDVAALAAAILRHLQDPSPLEAKARLGAEAAARRFDPQAAADAHRDVLVDVTDERPRQTELVT